MRFWASEALAGRLTRLRGHPARSAASTVWGAPQAVWWRADPGRFETGRFEAGRFEAGRFEAGRFEAGRREAGPRSRAGFRHSVVNDALLNILRIY